MQRLNYATASPQALPKPQGAAVDLRGTQEDQFEQLGVETGMMDECRNWCAWTSIRNAPATPV